MSTNPLGQGTPLDTYELLPACPLWLHLRHQFDAWAPEALLPLREAPISREDLESFTLFARESLPRSVRVPDETMALAYCHFRVWLAAHPAFAFQYRSSPLSH
jgi:hypothetical protein